jgi:hypothetical protein
MSGGNAAQFIIQHYCQLIQDGLISTAEPFQQLGYWLVHSTQIILFLAKVAL